MSGGSLDSDAERPTDAEMTNPPDNDELAERIKEVYQDKI